MKFMPSQISKKILFVCLLVFFVLGFSLTLAEIVLRLQGYISWNSNRPFQTESTLFRPHPVLGWVNKNEKIGEVTFLPDGSRSTGFHGNKSSKTIYFVGGSFMQGWGLADQETFLWNLQKRYPKIEFKNYGTGGYGTYQTLLLLEELLSNAPRPDTVIYGFNLAHEDRNVGDPVFLRMLTKYAQRGHVQLPYVSLDHNGEIKRHDPISFHPWFPARFLASINVFQYHSMAFQARQRMSYKRHATKKLIQDMAALCRVKGVEFIVFIMGGNPEAIKDYIPFFQQERISFIPCVVPLTQDRRIPGDGHPNAEAQKLWVDCFVERGVDFEGAIEVVK